MEESTQATPAQIEEQFQELAPLNIIRTETVLSKLPIHNLAKKGTINIHIIQKNNQGKVELLWKVSPSRDYGEPRALAYKLDTIVINRRLDEAGDADEALLGHLLLVAGELASKLKLEKGFRIVINNGPDACESVPHVHVHLLAKRQMGWPPG